MTQPYQPQQQYAPQGYAPQQYQQPPAQFPQHITQQGQGVYAPQPPQGGQTLPTQAPQLGQSGRAGGGATAPQPRHLVGRTVIFEPIRIDETTTAKDSAGNMVSRPTAHYHLTVVDGGPLQYGDNRDHDVTKQHGMTFEVQTPCRFTSVSSDRFGIVNEVRDAIARGDMASVGVIVQGTQGNRPFLVTKPGRDLDGKDRPDGDQRFQLAMDVWQKIWAKDLSWNPTPRSLVAPPTQAPQQVSYQQPQAPGAQPYIPVQHVGAQPTYAQAYAQQTAPGFQTPYAAANPGTGPYGDGPPAGYQPQQYAAPAPAPQPAMDPGYAAYLAAQQAAAAPPVPQSAPPVDPQYAAWQAAQTQQQGQPQPTGGPGF